MKGNEMNTIEKQQYKRVELEQRVNLLNKICHLCVLAVVTGFITLAIGFVDPLFKTTFDKAVEVFVMCVTGGLFVLSVALCALYMIRARKEVR